MTDLEAIELRISRRSYSGHLSEPEMQKLRLLVQGSNAKSGLAFRFLQHGATAFSGISKSYGMFSGVGSLFVLAGDEKNQHLLEQAGYYGERLVLEATKMGLGTCWVGGTYDRKKLAQALEPWQKLVAVITVGPVKNKRSPAESLIRALTHRGGKTIEQTYTADQAPPEWFMQGVEAALKAPSAIHRQPVHFTYRQGKVTAEIPADSEHEWIDLGIAKLHFELAAGGKFELGNQAEFTPDAKQTGQGETK